MLIVRLVQHEDKHEPAAENGTHGGRAKGFVGRGNELCDRQQGMDRFSGEGAGARVERRPTAVKEEMRKRGRLVGSGNRSG